MAIVGPIVQSGLIARLIETQEAGVPEDDLEEGREHDTRRIRPPDLTSQPRPFAATTPTIANMGPRNEKVPPWMIGSLLPSR